MTTNRRDVIKGTLALAGRSAVFSGGMGVAGTLVSCGGGGGSSAPSIAAPSALSYTSPAQTTAGTAVTAMAPTVTGTVTSYSVNPALPAGLSLNTTSGVISGTPTAAMAQAVYTVTATNAGGSTTFALSLTVNAAFAIASLSSSTPTALTALTLMTTGIDTTKAFTVTLTSSTVSGSIVLQPLRTNADGTVVVAMPLTVNGSTGATTSFGGQLTITQNGKTTAPVNINIADIPQLSDLGVGLGTISRAFYIHQQLAAAGNLNAQQAFAALPNVTPKASTLQADLALQLTNAILAINDVDRIITDNSTSISAGVAADGTTIAFTSKSLELQDRIIGQYLLLSTSNGTAIPQSANGLGAKRAKGLRKVEAFTIPAGAVTQITQLITSASGWVAFKTGQQTLQKSDSTWLDNALAQASQYQTIAVLGTTAVALGASLVGAPVVAALAGAALTYEVLGGVIIGAASIGNDLVNVATTGYDAYQASGTDTVANGKFSSAVLALGTDAFTTAINAVGVGAFASGSVVGNTAESVFNSLWGKVSGADATLGAAAFAASLGNLYLQNKLIADSAATEDGITQMAALSPSPQAGFGTVSGTATITNDQGPILSGQTGAEIGIGSSTFSGITDPSGAYDILVPLGNTALNYSQSTLSVYDPITGLVLNSEPLDLSTLTSKTIDTAPPVTGICSDPDASSPDADDPDCD
jgi:hypothetical protein